MAAATLVWAVGCDKKPLPPMTSASAVPLPSASAAPAPPALNPDFLADRLEEYTSPRRVIARIQGDLERIAAGKEPSKQPPGIKLDEFEAIVPAYRLVLQGDAGAADALDKVVQAATARLDAKRASAKVERERSDEALPKGHNMDDYAKLVSAVANEPIKNADGLITRLVATMRLVDAVLLLESGHVVYDYSYDLFDRHDEHFLRPIDHFRDGIWLRLPCPTLAKHRAAIEAADKRLGKAAGPLLSCPTPEKREHDYDFMERFAKDPGAVSADVVPAPASAKPNKPAIPDPVAPPPPWNDVDAILFMGDNPDAADKPLAAAAAKSIVGKLDYALFLHTFRPASKERDATIKKLMTAIDKASVVEAKKRGDEFLETDSSIGRADYNGTEESLIGSIRFASSSGSANTTSAFYSIPCAILLARPKLLDATEPLFGSNRDNFLPRAGCGWGRGFVRDFPDADLDKWRRATEEADGYFMFNFAGTMRFGMASAMNLEEETMRLNPRKMLEFVPTLQTPYETWSYMTPESRVIYKKLMAIAEPLKSKLIAHYKLRGINETDAEKMARAGMFRVVWGADCGKAPPPYSLRKLVVDGAPASKIRAFVESNQYKNEEKLEPFRECAEVTGIDPLVHVAVMNPDALATLWELFPHTPEHATELDLELDPNMPNVFGKTPLMVAAQQNQVESAKRLLDRGASIHRTTFKRGNQMEHVDLGHDARTALMYAAARGSLDMIRLLLDRGADKYAADTKGRRAVHYLLGLGPVQANPTLSVAERAEAAKLLY